MSITIPPAHRQLSERLCLQSVPCFGRWRVYVEGQVRSGPSHQRSIRVHSCYTRVDIVIWVFKYSRPTSAEALQCLFVSDAARLLTHP